MLSLQHGGRAVAYTVTNPSTIALQIATTSSRAECWAVRRSLHQSTVWQKRRPPSAVVSATRSKKVDPVRLPARNDALRPSESSSASASSSINEVLRRASPSPEVAYDDKAVEVSHANDATSKSQSRGAKSQIHAGRPKVKGAAYVHGTASDTGIQRGSRLQSRSGDYWRDLARVAEPVVLYRAPPHTQLRLMAYGSLVSCVCIAKFTFGPYAQFAGSNTLMVVGGGVVSLFWLAMGTYLVAAPQKMIRSISAVPEKTALVNPDTGPALQIEFEPTLPGLKPVTHIIPAIELSRDAPIEEAVHLMLQARQQEKLRFSWGKSFFIRMRSILFDFITLFTRKSFVYIKMPHRGGNGKIELPGALNYDRGRALEEVLRLNESKKTTFRKMFFSDPPRR